MTSDEAVGRTVREFQEKNDRATTIRSELRRVGEALVQFGTALQKSPHLIQLASGGFPMELLSQMTPSSGGQQFDGARTGQLLGELRQLEDSLRFLRQELSKLGLKPE